MDSQDFFSIEGVNHFSRKGSKTPVIYDDGQESKSSSLISLEAKISQLPLSNLNKTTFFEKDLTNPLPSGIHGYPESYSG
mgnify:FL=1